MDQKLNASRTGYQMVVLDGQRYNLSTNVRTKKPWALEQVVVEVCWNRSLRFTEDETETSESGNGKGKTDKASRLEELFEEQMRIGKKFAAEDEGRKAGMPGSLSSALMTFGLNLLAQPGGNLAGAIGKAGAPALSKIPSS